MAYTSIQADNEVDNRVANMKHVFALKFLILNHLYFIIVVNVLRIDKKRMIGGNVSRNVGFMITIII